MTEQNYTAVFEFKQTPQEVFDAINDVYGWWSNNFKGASQKTGDEFEVRFGDVHYSRQRLTESIPGEKIAWLVTDSNLSFLQNKEEWNGTSIIFDISKEEDKTLLKFTHEGLVPAIECFKDCSKGWNYFLQESLLSRITEGKGNPNVE